MKNIKITLLVVSLLLAIAATYFFTDSKGTLSRRNTHFAVEKTDQIDKIKISSPKEKMVIIKENKQWKINNKYIARQRIVENFLMALNRIQISSPVSNTEKDRLAKVLESEGKLVEIYRKNRTLRKYYVSTPEIDPNKTYMMMAKRDEPISVRIPSFKGLVAELFSTDESLWRDKTIFDYQPQNIKSITAEYFDDPSKSFTIINYGNGTFSLKQPDEGSFVEVFDIENVARYFTYFQGIRFERIETNLSKQKTDSLLQSEPYCTISVTDVDDFTNSITIYRKPPEKEFDEFGNKLKFDYNRAYAIFNQNNELIIIQYYIFDPLLKEIDYFR
ncbi:MAG TPA: hypothetical protein VK982_07810 [Bacteroidales bacterium]|nr:hypothetical protein [Bacteroidales bacterium]